MEKICELCQREVENITEHHLIPKTLHGNKKIKKIFSIQQLKNNKLLICESCHGKIHSTFTEKELAETYHTFRSILEHPEIKKFIDWIKNKPGSMVIKSKNKNT
jgi:hypothetical protein